MSQPPLALCVPCTIHIMHDGDTATKASITLDIEIRYRKCWAPELSQKGGPEARDAAKAVEGKKGRLLIPLEGVDNIAQLLTFGRVLGEFYPDGQEESESERLVRLGYATKEKVKPPAPKGYAPGPNGGTFNGLTADEWDNCQIGPQKVAPRSVAAINAEITALTDELEQIKLKAAHDQEYSPEGWKYGEL